MVLNAMMMSNSAKSVIVMLPLYKRGMLRCFVERGELNLVILDQEEKKQLVEDGVEDDAGEGGGRKGG